MKQLGCIPTQTTTSVISEISAWPILLLYLAELAVVGYFSEGKKKQ